MRSNQNIHFKRLLFCTSEDSAGTPVVNDQEPQGHNPELATSDELSESQLVPETTIDTATVDGSATRAFQVRRHKRVLG